MDVISERSLVRSVQRESITSTLYPRLIDITHRLITLIVGLGVFVVALQLLKQGSGQYGHSMLQWLQVSDGTSALGLGWLLSYVFLSGSPVAAVSVSLFAVETISDWQTFMMITGSRLGASFIVLLVGFVYYLRGHRHTTSLSVGVVALLTTAAIYLPAILPGYWLLTSGVLESWQIASASSSDGWIEQLVGPIVHMLAAWIPGWALLLCGMLGLVGGFSLIDRAMPEITPEHSAALTLERIITSPLALFVLGAAITAVTMSVAVSVSLFVPLAIKGMVQPRHSVPYIMGANITTFIDTLLAAFVAGGAAAFTIVLVELVSVLCISLIVLLFFYRPFERAILYLQEQITGNRYLMVLFLGGLIGLPVALIVC